MIADGECYYFGEHTKKPWEKALSYCEALTPCTSLAAPLTEAVMTALVDKAKAINWPTVWLAGSEETGREWRWASPHGNPVDTKHLYNISTMSYDVVHMSYKCFVFAWKIKYRT